MGLVVRRALVGLVLMVLALPAIGEARAIHYFQCNDCHRAGAGYNSLKNINNVCSKCHDSETGLGSDGGAGVGYSDSSTGHKPTGRFVSLAASNAMGRHPDATNPLLTQTSHNWSATDNYPAAGAEAPTTLLNYGRYTAGWVACSRCHDPHTAIEDTSGYHMLRLPVTGDAICLDCHRSWNRAEVDARLTHPIVADYATIAANKPNDFNPTPVNTGSGDVRLVSGGVSCTSCHGLHFTDSDSRTVDLKSTTLNTGDGKLLRTDGELRTGPARNGTDGTAQLRSNLCQACHTIELHGQGTDNHKIGCLECHGGHSYNGGTPSAFILRDVTPGPVPTRPNGTNSVSDSVVTFNNFPVSTSTRLTWADQSVGGTAGFCERCHGDVNSAAMVSKSDAHGVTDTNECSSCHKHNDPANTYSFNRDASAATCGQCHGFPPYLDTRGDKGNDPDGTGPNPPLGTLGGYAYNYVDVPEYDYKTSTAYGKNEATTGHKVHAGRDVATSPANTSADDWYFVGSSGNANCIVCHGPDAGKTAGGHRIAPSTRPDTFRDVPFGAIALQGMSPAPQYNINSPWTCTNVYCHTNGAPYNGGSRPNRVYTRVNTTPPWVGTGADYAAGGFGSIHGQTSPIHECASCHGNTAATMDTGVDPKKSNSVAHLAHLGGATTLGMGKTFSCAVCHVQTATSPTALAVNAMDGRDGGKHVNGAIDVDFETGSTPDTLPEALTGSTYTAATGVCSTYCHNVTGAGGAMAADWDDVATDMQCDSCHGGLATDISGNGGYGPIATYAHSRHVTSATGPKLSCDDCHDVGASIGNVSTHIDGAVTMKAPGGAFADICEECHGYEAGEVLPVWTNLDSEDCATCHAGGLCGSDFSSAGGPLKGPLHLVNAKTTGHNRPAASGNFPESGNAPANLACTVCHLSDSPNHWDGVSYSVSGNAADLMLRADNGFPGTYTGGENSYCNNCHGASPAHPTNAASAATRSINTHQSKLCVACHNVHGEQNIQMIWVDPTDQNSHDNSTGKYGGTFVWFTNVTNFLAGNTDSYDEDDFADGGVTESNSDDLCATCHSSAATNPTLHNNIENTDNKGPTGHKMGQNCFPCHAPHTDATNAFKVGTGTACNDCHGFPPATGAHRKGTLTTDPELHSDTGQVFEAEDRSDCAKCHTGSDYYTYDLTADQADVVQPGRNNHAVSKANRQAVLLASVGYSSANLNCSSACHASTAGVGNGIWTDTTGLKCDACHYAAQTPTGALNTAAGTRAVSSMHNKHFDKSKTCAECHDVSFSAGFTAVRGPLSHVVLPDYFGPGNDGNLIEGRAMAALDEATVASTSHVNMVYSGGAADGAGINNTCSGTSFELGCHASAGTAASKPDWDVTIPATSAGCVMCHTETDSLGYNPTSGLHDNNPGGPTVTGNAHDGSFNDGNAGTADCVTCHTASPTVTAADHIDGTLNASIGSVAAPQKITLVSGLGYTDAVTPTCAETLTGCHSAGSTWAYKWSTSAYDIGVNECDNCHGMYGSWSTGVAPHTEIATRGNKHNSFGNLTYPCSDCHAIGSAGYKWISKWDPTGTNSNHGDTKITMNAVAGTNVFDIDTAPTPDRAGCTTTSCHNKVVSGGLTGDTTHTFPISTTAFTTQTVTGTAPAVSCSTCHGGYAGTNANGYWPNDGTNTISNASEDNSGAHLKHMTALAQSVYTETLAQLLTNNGKGTADAKQKFLCAYCHATPGSDGDHGVVANLPAEVNSMYALWDVTRSTPDNGFYNRDVDKTCATVDCHSNKTTPTAPTSYTWYSGSTSACIMCHVDITNGTVPNSNGGTHVAHTSAATNFGRPITCDDCHKTAIETVAWGSPGTPPTNLHMNGTFAVTGTVPFTYTAGQGCGTNACHNAGNGVTAPASGATTYPWGTALADCTICHAAVPTVTAAHTAHLGNTTLVPNGCNECHDAATLSTHIDAKVDFGGVVTAPATNASYDGSCTNNCHVAGVGYWSGGPAALACADCHSGSYVGGNNWRTSGNNYLAQSGLHATTATNVTPHNQTLAGGCTACHTAYASAPASHVDNVWQADGAANSESRFISLAGYGELAVNSSTCSGAALTGCHSDQGSWSRLWSTAADSDYIATPATGQAVCNVCHGSYSTITNSTGWRAGTVHARSGGTKGSGHTDANIECEDCHAYPGVAGKHEDGFITMSGDTDAITTTGEDYQLAWGTHGTNPGWYCASCHNGVAAEDALTGTTHTFVDSLAFPSPTKTPTHEKIRYADGASAPEGGCTGCHGNTGTGGYWPDGSKGGVRTAGTSGPADRPGKHAQHVWEIAKKKYSKPSPSAAEQNTTCDYCHPNPGAGGHNDATAPADMHNGTTTKFKRIVTPFGLDNNAVVNGSGTAYVTCNNIDCHFDMPRTPQWYSDDIPPAEVGTFAAVPGPDPGSIKLTWVAPGDDANELDTTPYVYDVRVATSSANAGDFLLTNNYAGGMPAAYRQGTDTEMIVQGLNPLSSYYFGIRTRDTGTPTEPGIWSTGTVTTLPVTPTADLVAPQFGGAGKASKGDDSQSIDLSWTAAEDHSMPITYKVWMVQEGLSNGGPLVKVDFTNDLPVLTGVTDTKIRLQNGQVYYGNPALSIANDKVYYLGVRACDKNDKCDVNTQVVSATPTAVPTVAVTNETYATNGSSTLIKGGAAGTGLTTQALPLVFTPATSAGTTNTYQVKYFADTFAIYVNASSGSAATLRVTLGYTTDGTNFTASAFSKDITIARRGSRVYTIKLGDTAGRTITAGQSFALQLSDPGGAGLTVNFGSTATRGDLTMVEQITNVAPTVPTNNASSISGAIATIKWNASLDNTDGPVNGSGQNDSVHYDLYGSDDGGTSYEYLIATGLTTTSYTWDAQTSGVPFGSTLRVKVRAGDGRLHTDSAAIALGGNMPAADTVAPGQITDLVANKRAKAGTVYLTWTAPGDDYGNHGRADHYDIRFDTRQIVETGGDNVTTVNFASIPAAGQATHEPTPDFGGHVQHYEVTNLTPGQNYYFAIKTVDEVGNTSLLSLPKYPGPTPPRSDLMEGGPRCGMCHATGPNVMESVGNHKLHGFTLKDCDKCHTEDPSGTPIKPSAYALDHQDGRLVMGYGSAGAFPGFVSGTTIYYTANGVDVGPVLYSDTVGGFGGFGDGTYNGTGTDDGSCFNFSQRLTGGCHSTAGSDPDGAGPLPSYKTPTWSDTATLDCKYCHGNPNRGLLTGNPLKAYDPYGRDFDATTANGGTAPDQILGSPLVDNHGNYDPAGTVTKYIGQHEKHLNYSFRFAKGDSCNLCHPGDYALRYDLDGKHANGDIDVKLDTNAAGPLAQWNAGAGTTPGTCSSMSPESCHPTAETPSWDSKASFDCVGCHNMGGITPAHVTDPNKLITDLTATGDPQNTNDGGPMQGNCTWCHFGGHPQGTIANGVLLPNNSQVGISYRSGGVHLRTNIGGRNMDLDGNLTVTQPEVCWSCHDSNSISEWGTDVGDNNAASTKATYAANPNYDYGQIYLSSSGAATSLWVTTGTTGAWWKSGTAAFAYKNEKIQSTHSTNDQGGTAAVTLNTTPNPDRYEETPDSLDKIRCHNCHDVHNLNKAPNDAMTGKPYLRGTWVRNPYPEDGAPLSTTGPYGALNKYMEVPRGGIQHNEVGGFQIDQNNNSPTRGLGLGSSAGLCTLCHGTNIDAMDKTTGEALWVGINGHSNSAIGGTADDTAADGNPVYASDILNFAQRNPTVAPVNATADYTFGGNPSMGYQHINIADGSTTRRADGFRSAYNGKGYGVLPKVVSTYYAYQDFNWGVTQDNGTIDKGYHAFTCSKCHNPHASRLPKLMITNCLDTRHNTWDDGRTVSGSAADGNNTATADNSGKTLSNVGSAQNCHRLGDATMTGKGAGWNKVTPW